MIICRLFIAPNSPAKNRGQKHRITALVMLEEHPHTGSYSICKLHHLFWGAVKNVVKNYLQTYGAPTCKGRGTTANKLTARLEKLSWDLEKTRRDLVFPRSYLIFPKSHLIFPRSRICFYRVAENFLHETITALKFPLP